MRFSPSTPLRRARDQVREDLVADPYLRYILLLSVLLVSFWLWHRLPNFATRDERWRVVDSMEAVGFLLEDFSFDSLQSGVDYWRSFGATFYLYGLVALPMFAVAFVTGQADVFAHLPDAWTVDLFAHWQAIPEWMWWAAVLPARMVNASLAVASVYLVYRIVTRLRDRPTGRLASLLTTLTWAVVFLAHEAGEDIPMLFCLLAVFYFAVDYVDTGTRRSFLYGSAFAGVAIGFKLTGGLGVVFLGVAFLLRAGQAGDDTPLALQPLLLVTLPGLVSWLVFTRSFQFAGAIALGYLVALGWTLSRPAVRKATLRPAMLLGGLALAVGFLFASFPGTLVNGPGVVIERVARGVGTKSVPHGWLDRPSWWWLLRGSLNGLGWPLFLAAVAAVGVSLLAATVSLASTIGSYVGPDRDALSSLPSLPDRDIETAGIVLALTAVGVVLGIYLTWEYFRTHHLLPVFPLLSILVALSLARLEVHRSTVARTLAVLLLVTTAIYTGVGTFGYATNPRDQAVNYMVDNGGPNATVETYSYDSQEAAVPHGFTIYRPTNRSRDRGITRSLGAWMGDVEERCPDFIALNYQRSMLWLAPSNHSALADRWARPGAERVIRDFLRTEGPYLTANAPYPYSVAGEFGPRPVFLDTGKPMDPTWNAVRAGIYPRTIQYGDPQDFGVYGYVLVLERTGECSP